MFDMDYLMEKMPAKFIKSYNMHRVELMMNVEKELLVDASKIVEMEKTMSKYSVENSAMDEEVDKIQSKIADNNSKILVCRYEINSMRRGECNNGKKMRFNSIIKCPSNECRGMVEIDNEEVIKCNICLEIICSKCMCICTFDHCCNVDVAKNVKEIMKSCKNCPGCKIPITKSEGCPQMWCTECHTAFDWNTGLIVKVSNCHAKANPTSSPAYLP